MQQRLPKVKLWNLYGQTEIAPLATALQPEDQLRMAGSAGRAAINVETRIVDDDMNDVKPGGVGEVVHRSPQLLTGYYNDPERTAAAFKGGWFHSGDMGKKDADGYYYIVDRKKDLIIRGGMNIYPREIEEVLYNHPKVFEAAVVGVPDELRGEEVKIYVSPREGQALVAQEIQDYVEEHLAKYKWPTAIEVLPELPKGPTGKILKRELKLQATEQMKKG